VYDGGLVLNEQKPKVLHCMSRLELVRHILYIMQHRTTHGTASIGQGLAERMRDTKEAPGWWLMYGIMASPKQERLHYYVVNSYSLYQK
jgi:hypothetical protein